MFLKIFFENLNLYPTILFIIAFIWNVFWKGIGLWRASKNNQKIWFIIILIINTFGILEILYLAFFQKQKAHPLDKKEKKQK